VPWLAICAAIDRALPATAAADTMSVIQGRPEDVSHRGSIARFAAIRQPDMDKAACALPCIWLWHSDAVEAMAIWQSDTAFQRYHPLLSAPPEAAARPPRPHRVLAFAQGLSAHRAGHPLFPTVCRQDETSSRSIGKHELEIQG
jgi:hypothetical protein